MGHPLPTRAPARTALVVSGAALLLAVLADCRAPLDQPERYECIGDYAAPQIFRARCADVGCHGSTPPQGNDLDLASDGVWGRVFLHSSEASTDVIVSDVGPEESLLVEKVSGMPRVGAPMPLGKEPLSSGEIACVKRWIDDNLAAGTPAATVVPDAGTSP